MAASTLLLWDVDTQVDFLDPEGKLYVPGAEQIEENLFRLNAWAEIHGVPLVSSVDAHRPGDPEFEVYGPHCLVGTPGQAKVIGTVLNGACVISNRELVPLPAAGTCRQVIFEKETLDVFTNPNVDAWLSRMEDPLHVILYGVVTEICVDYTARGLLERGHRVDLVEDATRHLDAAKAAKTIERIRQSGGKVLKTQDLVQHPPGNWLATAA